MNYSLATKKIHFSGGFSWAGTPNPIFPNDGEGNIRKAKLKPFDMDDCAVTHARFLQFVSETNYVTDAEKLGWSFVFRGPLPEAERGRGTVRAQLRPEGGDGDLLLPVLHGERHGGCVRRLEHAVHAVRRRLGGGARPG